MYSNETISEINRLNFEDIVWIIYATSTISNVYGNYYDKLYLKTNNEAYMNRANDIFEITLIITFLVYIYFLLRNYKLYKRASSREKELYLIRVFGTILVIVGVICLIYFQTKKSVFGRTSAR